MSGTEVAMLVANLVAFLGIASLFASYYGRARMELEAAKRKKRVAEKIATRVKMDLEHVRAQLAVAGFAATVQNPGDLAKKGQAGWSEQLEAVLQLRKRADSAAMDPRYVLGVDPGKDEATVIIEMNADGSQKADAADAFLADFEAGKFRIPKERA